MGEGGVIGWSRVMAGCKWLDRPCEKAVLVIVAHAAPYSAFWAQSPTSVCGLVSCIVSCIVSIFE